LKESKDSVTSVHVVQEADDDDDNTANQQQNRNKKNNTSSSSTATAIIRTSSVDGMVRSYDLRKGLLQCDDCHAAITGMAPTRDGQCLAISGLDGVIRLMEMESGELLNTYLQHHVAGNYGLQCCLTADDATIVSGSEDGRVILYDLVRGSMVQALEGHQRPTCAVTAHPQRTSVIITASYDGTAVVWANEQESYLQS
jgi:mitogen-activated protein kinase organizer 1